MDLIDIFGAFHPKAVEDTYFSSAHGMFSRMDHMFGQTTSHNKFRKTEIISSIFTDHNAMKLEINHKNTEKHSKIWKLNNMLLNYEWVSYEVKEVIKRYLETNENETTTIQNLWDTGKAIIRGKFINYRPISKKQQKLK